MNLVTIFPELSHGQWAAHIIVFLINIALLVLAHPILKLIDHGEGNETKLKIFRTLNILVLSLHVIDLIFLSLNKSYEHYFIRVGLSLMAIYASLFAYSVCCFFSRKRFGTQKTFDNKTVFLDTYSSRLVDIVLLIIIGLTSIYALIKIWGADSMLETTGIFGIIAALLAFTSNIWAPDVISGLIILNTEILEDGDVVVVDGHPDEYVISKVTLVYVILYDVRNNHRTLIRNNQFIRSKIDNISRIASTDGVRQALTYKIGYPEFTGASKDERKQELQKFKAKINQMFNNAYLECQNNPDIKINGSRSFEWSLTQAGDFALEYTLWVYLARIPNTKITATIRRHLMGTIYLINETVYDSSILEQVNLSTPTLNNIAICPPSTKQPLTS